jgi:hypothetical protein
MANKLINSLLAAFLVTAIVGCASPANKDEMAPKNFVTSQKFTSSVNVKTTGGSETGAMDSSNISDEDLKAAIEKTITESGLFSNVVDIGGANYLLAVSITSLTKPSFGLTFTVNLETAWILTNLADKKIVFRKAIMTSGSATFGDAAAAVSRLRIAVERAAEQNIAQGLTEISALKLK